MSWLSKATGVHISPKGFSLSAPDPLGTVKDIVQNPLPLLGLALPGIGSALGGVLGSLPGAAAVGGALSSIPGASAVGSALGAGGAAGAATSAIPDAALGIGSGGSIGLGGFLGKAGEFLTKDGGKNALGVAQGINAALQQKKSNDYARQALDTVEGRYNAQAPLRAQGLAGLMRKDVGNPYAGSF